MALTVAELVAKLTADTSDFVGGMDRASAATSSFERSTGASLGKIGGFAESAGRMLTLGLTAPVVAGVGLSIKAFADFESTLNKFKAVSGATGEEMERVGALAKKLGADISLPGTSASDAALAMTELAKAGFTVQQSMDAARGVLQLSAAAQIDNAQAAEIASNAINAFGLEASEANRVADLLAASANASSAEITDVALAFQMSASVFAAAKIPIEDLTTAIGLMANAGIKGSDAGTSLKTMLMHLQSPSAEAAAAMKALGINIYDAQGNMIPFRDIVGQVSTAVAGMTQQQRDAALATIFGADAVRAANIVLAGGTQAWDAMKTAVTEAGAAQKLAESNAKGFGGQLDALKSSLETLAISLGEKLVPIFSGLVGAIQGAVDWFSNLDPIMQNVLLGFIGLAAAIGPVLLIAGKLAQAWVALNVALAGTSISAGAVAASLGKVGIVLGTVVTIMAIFSPTATDAEEAQNLFNDALRQTGPAAQQAIQGVIATVIAEKQLIPLLDQAGLSVEDFYRAVLSGARAFNDGGEAAAAFANRIGELNAAGVISDEVYSRLLGIQGDLSFTYQENQRVVNDTKTATEALNGVVGEAGTVAGSTQTSIQAMVDQIRSMGIDAEDARKVLANLGYTTEQAEEIIKQAIPTLDEFGESLKTTFDSALDPLNRLKVNTEITMASIKTTLQGNIKDLTTWADNLRILAERGHGALAMEMAKLGPTAATAVAQMTTASNSELTKIEGLFGTKAQMTGAGYITSLQSSLTGVQGATGQITTAINGVPSSKPVSIFVNPGDVPKIQADTGNITGNINAIPNRVPTVGLEFGALLGGVLQVNSSINSIPTSRSMYMASDHGAFLGAVQQIKSAIASIPRSVTTTYTITGSYTNTLQSMPIPIGAEGALVSKPTLALIGEAGPELLMPLHKMPGAAPVPDMSRDRPPGIDMALSRANANGVAAITNHIEIFVSGSVVTERDLVDAVHEGLLAKQRRNGTLGLNS